MADDNQREREKPGYRHGWTQTRFRVQMEDNARER